LIDARTKSIRPDVEFCVWLAVLVQIVPAPHDTFAFGTGFQIAVAAMALVANLFRILPEVR
jgi:hypothetical protein